MTLKQLKEIVNERFNVDISIKNRKRKYVYPKKIYCYIAALMEEESLECIGKEINISHDNVLFHKKTINNIYEKQKVVCNKIIKEYGLNVPFLEVEEVKKLQPISDNSEMNYINHLLFNLTDSQLYDLRKTRIEPYLKMITK